MIPVSFNHWGEQDVEKGVVKGVSLSQAVAGAELAIACGMQPVWQTSILLATGTASAWSMEWMALPGVRMELFPIFQTTVLLVAHKSNSSETADTCQIPQAALLAQPRGAI